MSKESVISEISQELKNDGSILEDSSYMMIGGVKVRFPYCDLSYLEYRDYISSPAVWESKKRLYELFHNQLPDKWVNFIKEIGDKRVMAGNDTPLDLIIGAGYIIDENLEYAKKVGIQPYKHDSEDYCDYRDIENLVKTINTVIEDPHLGSLLRKSLIIQMPDQGANWDKKNTIEGIYKDLALQGKCVLDIGVGTGYKTTERFKTTKVKTIAIDRQFHGDYYKEFWVNGDPNIQFMMSDATEAIPLKNDSVDFVLMECIVPHITLESLEKILLETERVLKINGILMVGPEETRYNYGDPGWKYYVKLDEDEHTTLKEIDLEDVGRIIGARSFKVF